MWKWNDVVGCDAHAGGSGGAGSHVLGAVHIPSYIDSPPSHARSETFERLTVPLVGLVLLSPFTTMSNRLAVTLCTSLPRVFYSPSLVTLSHSLSSCHSVYRLVVAQPYTNGRRPLSIATVVTCFKPFTNTCILSQQVCLKDCVVCNNRLYQRRRYTYTYPVTYIHTRAHGLNLSNVSHSLSSQPFVTCIKSFNQ